nr:cysteine protease StiP family protein [Bacillus sp. 1NLA3E]
MMKKPDKIGTYQEEDVLFLLKDLSGIRLEGPTNERENQIQLGQHYSETLPIETLPPKSYMDLFWSALEKSQQKLALDIAVVAEQIFHIKGKETVLVSLARAGTPIGILIKRYLLQRYQVSLPHYSISIIRGRGVDDLALQHIVQTHPGMKIQFVDGWTGKGAISIELTTSCQRFFERTNIKLDDTLAVVADPGNCTNLYGTREDYLIPNACLNSTVSGLISRTVLNDALIGPDDFHGAKFYREFMHEDVSNTFIHFVAKNFLEVSKHASEIAKIKLKENNVADFQGLSDVKEIQARFQIDHINLVKPGVGETTRVLLRRVPWRILIRDKTSPDVAHILMLAKEKNVEVIFYPEMKYSCCGLIKKMVAEKK